MTGNVVRPDRDRIRELFDLRSDTNASHGGNFEADPYPAFHELRSRGSVHEGVVHTLIGYDGDAMFHGLPYPDRLHFSVFGYAECDQVYRDNETFSSDPEAGKPEAERGIGPLSSMLSMDGAEHRRYRGLVQPSFVPSRARWWIEQWIQETVDSLVDALADDERADLNVDFCAPIPMFTITGSFGVSVDDALDLRASLRDGHGSGLVTFLGIIEPIVAARREHPEDDLISVLAQAELTDDDGVTHRLSDPEILSFSYLLLAAGSGTTWKQMGIAILALLERPELLAAVRADRELLRGVIEEVMRWCPTDPMFSRWATRDTVLGGLEVPAGSVVHLCIGAANRDPARWPDPDVFDPYRKPQSNFGFGGGRHMCLGMHVARAEMFTGISALLDTFPDLRLDPQAETPHVIGIYERGPSAVPVLLGAADRS